MIGRDICTTRAKKENEWQKPGTNGSGRGTNDKRNSRSRRKDRNENNRKDIRIGRICWLMSMKMGTLVQNHLITRSNDPL